VTRSFVLRSANVLDESGGFSGPLDVVVREGRITQVGRDASAADLRSVDFAGLWLMPGVFDCHDHLTLHSWDAAALMQTPVSRWALHAAEAMRRTLECGVTFVRDAGGADAGLRDGVQMGLVPGPRMQISVVALSETGGHFDGFWPGTGMESAADYCIPDYPGRPPFIVDGVQEMRRAVRRVLRAGADWIKLCTTGGVASPYDAYDEPQFTLEEVAVAVAEARRRKRGVMTHAFGGEGLDNSITAGVASIEHGIFLTEEQAARMAERGIWLVPTLAILRDSIRWGREGLLSDFATEKMAAIEPQLGDAVRIAREYGVKLALGTDYVQRDQHGNNLEELHLMHQAGLSVEETLLAATVRGAELCGVAADYGTIAPGKVLDAIVLDEDPGDLSLFTRRDAVTGVFKGGDPVVAHPRVAAALGPRPPLHLVRG
jgi:imidazolonepropionase-like amidohydrolase